jgi:hypothetical protein
MKKARFLLVSLVLLTLSSCGSVHVGEDTSKNNNVDTTAAGYEYSEIEFAKKAKAWAAYNNYNISPLELLIQETKDNKNILLGFVDINVDESKGHYYCSIELTSNFSEGHKDIIDGSIYFQALIDGETYWAQTRDNEDSAWKEITTSYSLTSIKDEINKYYSMFTNLVHFQGLPSGNFKYINTDIADQVQITTSEHIVVEVNGTKYIEATDITLRVNKYGYYDNLLAGSWNGNDGCFMTINAEYNMTNFNESRKK